MALAVVAFGLAAVHLMMGMPSDDAPRRVSTAQVRSVEDLGKVFDAREEYSEAVWALVGVDPERDHTAAHLAKNVEERLAAVAWSRELQLVGAALTVAYDQDASALRLVDRAVDKDASQAHKNAVAGVLALAEGRPAADPDELGTTLRSIGASEWLASRVMRRHHDNAGERVRADTYDRRSLSLARNRLDGELITGAVFFGLVLIGFFLLILGPRLRAVLLKRGWVGLGPAGTPFRVDMTQRVILAWFIAHAVLAWTVPRFVQSQPLLLAAMPLLHGIVGLHLIQRLGREPTDSRPLTECLGLSMPRGIVGLIGWSAAGLPIAVFFALGASLLNVVLFGLPTESQNLVNAAIEADPTLLAAIGLSAVIFAPLVEEIIFRGYLFRNLRTDLSPVWAMLASGFIFAAVHLDPQHILPLTGLGVALAYLYELSGSLLVPIIVHALWNALQLGSVIAAYHWG